MLAGKYSVTAKFLDSAQPSLVWAQARNMIPLAKDDILTSATINSNTQTKYSAVSGHLNELSQSAYCVCSHEKAWQG